ncbi:MAG TPA: glucose-6-phosphate dehydrogenase, partial [Rhizomicrobium sp.]|nr:glucose-6-phosphate dehydrogenase [Rhizomicrobium sp.]
MSQVPPPCAMVIFGAGGDLTKRLVVPALYNLARANLLPQNFALIGVNHGGGTAQSWAEELHTFLDNQIKKTDSELEAKTIDAEAWAHVAAAMSYLEGDFVDSETYTKLAALLARLDKEKNLDGNVLFYLAVADRFFGPVVEHLGRADLVKPEIGWRRVIVEKPFGHDLKSAQALNKCLLEWLDENQIYRIDHFLGKETVQNIMAQRFANGLFEPFWNRDRIDHVQITVAESIGIETRGKFYEATGALRDMVPNHLFQLVAMTAMEPPVSFDADAVRARKAEVFKATHPIKPEDSVRGQYAA